MIKKVVNKEDVDKVVSLADEIWREHYTAIIGSAQVDYMLDKFQSARAIKDQIEEGYLYFLLGDGAKPIGYFAVQPKRKEGELFLSKFYIRRSSRGRGRGREALSFMEELAKKNSLAKIGLTVNKSNIFAIARYEKMGFKKTASPVTDIGGVFVMDDYRMEKAL